MNTTKGSETKRRMLVLFDVGSVLLKLDFGRFYEEAAKFSGNLSPEEFKEAYLSSNLEADFLSGRINTADSLAKLSGIISPEKEISSDELIKIVSYMWKEPIEEMIDLKERVYRAGYCVGIFSNMSKLGLGVISGMHNGIFETFEPSFPRILSFEVGEIKPSPKMYQSVSGYERVILIDDNQSYVRKGIDDFGWYGILFTPFIDKAEASRTVLNITAKPSKNLRIANSIESVIESLKFFGVEV